MLRERILEVTAPVQRRLRPDDPPLAFGRGRDNGIVLDPTDLSISRLAGTVEHSDGQWSVINQSTSRPIYTVDDTGIRLVLGVGQRRSILSEEFAVVVVGGHLTHTIQMRLTSTASESEVSTPSDSVDRTLVPSLTANEHLALVALCEGFLLDPPRHNPVPCSYERGADRLGISRSTMRKRIERVRQKLVDAGVVELESTDAREGLCEFALATRLVNKSHLDLLPA